MGDEKMNFIPHNLYELFKCLVSSNKKKTTLFFSFSLFFFSFCKSLPMTSYTQDYIVV